MVFVYYGEIGSIPEDPAGLPLSSYRLSQLSTLIPVEKRRQSIGAELLLIRALREQNPDQPLPLSIETDAFGKPYLKDLTYHFSLSHSGGYAACVIADRPVGLDIQILGKADPAVACRCFTRDERDYISDAEDRSASFTELWTRKESYAKAIGQGLRLPFNSFSALSPPGTADIWSNRLEDLFFSVCVLDGLAEPDLIQKRELP